MVSISVVSHRKAKLLWKADGVLSAVKKVIVGTEIHRD